MTALDNYLDMAYTAIVAEKSRNLPALVESFKTAIAGDKELLGAAHKRLSELNALKKARGFGSRNPCVMSEVYRKFLEENLNG